MWILIDNSTKGVKTKSSSSQRLKKKKKHPHVEFCIITHLSAQLAGTIIATLTLITSQFEGSLLVHDAVIKTLSCSSALRAARD